MMTPEGVAPPMKYRKLRIAFSIICVIACLIFVALWMRSQSWMDFIVGPASSSNGVAFGTTPNRLFLVYPVDRPFAQWYWGTETVDVFKDIIRDRGGGPDFRHRPDSFLMIWMVGRGPIYGVSIWIVVLIWAMLAIVPAIQWSKRFSVRTLLIATTLAAMVLGFAVWATNK